MTYVLSRKEKINGYWMNKCAMFFESDGGMGQEKRPCVEWYIKNDKGTYQRDLGNRRYFNTKEDGNALYKLLLTQGYKLVSKY